jgi:hypothetical protein
VSDAAGDRQCGATRRGSHEPAAEGDWLDLFDPAELRIRLDMALEENGWLRDKHARLETENARLRGKISARPRLEWRHC